jgi:acyl carrier protein
MVVRDKVLGILKGIRPEHDFLASQDFINDGLLDSFDIIVLVSELERELGWSIPGDCIRHDNFVSVEAMIAAFSGS